MTLEKEMNLDDLAEWLNEMEAVIPGCRLELAAFGGGGVVMTLRWMAGGKLRSYQHAIGVTELRSMVAGAQKQVLAIIRARVEDAMRHNV